MRIAIVAPEFPPEIGGMQRYAWEIAQGLDRHGFAVTVFTRERSLAELPPSNVEIIPCLKGSRWQDRDALLSRAGVFDLWHVMNAAWSWIAQEVKPVVLSIYGNEFLDPNPIVRLGLRERFKLPFGSRLDYHLGKWMTSRSMRSSLPSVRHFFAISRATEKLFLDRYPACKGKTSVDFLGVSDYFLQASPPAVRHKAPLQLITICRLSEPRKNVDVVLRALGRLKDMHEFRYVIIGDGPLRPGLEQLVCELGLGDRVQFLGSCSDEALRDQLLVSDLFILTSSAAPKTVEGFGIVYLEANACGVPVLAAQVGGAAEAVAEGRSGLFVKEITPELLAATLSSFLSGIIRFDPDECRAFAQSFAWPKILDRILHRYAEVAESSSVCIGVNQGGH